MVHDDGYACSVWLVLGYNCLLLHCLCLFLLHSAGLRYAREKLFELLNAETTLLVLGDTLGGNVGLAISQSLIIVGTLQHGVKQSGEMVSQITSVERILQYTQLPNEGSWDSDNPPASDWPKHGRLTLKNVNMKYDKNEPPVLKVCYGLLF